MSKRKISVLLISAFVALVALVSVVSYSIATRQPKQLNSYGADADSGNSTVIDKLTGLDYISNIDLIIQTSHEGTTYPDYTFNVVEVFPNGFEDPNSGLNQYITSDAEGFKKWVIDANKKESQDMASKMIDYKYIVAGPGTAVSDSSGYQKDGEDLTIQDVLNNADLIYLSSEKADAYNSTNNMSQAVFQILENYALDLNDKKPIILDTIAAGSQTGTSVRRYQDFVNDVKNYYIRYRTFGWDTNISADDFFAASGKSFYIQYNVNQKAPTGRILIINSTGAEKDEFFYKSLKEYGEENIKANAYYGPIAKRKDVTFEFTSPAALEADPTILSSLQYDFVFIEDDVKRAELKDEVYAALKRVAETSNYLIYRSDWIVEGGSGFIQDTDSNFHTLYNHLVSSEGVAMYTNVLLVDHSFFSDLNSAGEDGVTSAKQVADLINRSVYRGHGGGGDNRMYRVLEIQPCYPIDLEVAEKNPDWGSGLGVSMKGSYYTRPDNVYYGMTKEELPEGSEYYAFELSKAKIAKLTGLNYNRIALDQMSTEELISSKTVISEAYDLIYIGGDTSALVPPANAWYYLSSYANYNSGNPIVKGRLSNFGMYTHTGLMYPLTSVGKRSAMPTGDSNPAGTVVNGQTVVELNGNDLTTTKLEELKTYIAEGLPLIIEDSVASAFEETYAYDEDNKANRLKQLELINIDPDSNMYKFLKYAYKTKANNISWGDVDVLPIDSATELIPNAEQEYGDAASVRVYKEANTKYIRDLINRSAVRPRIQLEASPITYKEGDKKTINEGSELTFKASVLQMNTEVQNYVLNLYIDDDGDNVFSDSELKATADYTIGAASVNISVTLDEDFMGAVNWKLTAQEANGKLCDMVTGISWFKPTGSSKAPIRVLQIMPVNSATQEKYQNMNAQQPQYSDGHSLYLCTECQQASYRIKYNVLGSQNGTTVGFGSGNNKEKIWGDTSVGLHEHKFGIVKYVKDIKNDDWETNWADELNEYYDISIDIVTNDEFDKIWADAAGRSESDALDNQKLAENEKSAYTAALKTFDSSSSNLATLASNLEAAMRAALPKITGGKYYSIIEKNLETWIADRDYYKFWEYYNDLNTAGSYDNVKEVAAAYNAYITEYDKIVQRKQNYTKYMQQTATLTNSWLTANYDMVVLGFAEDFGGMDLSQESCNQIKTYINEGEGSVLNTHDTMSRYESAGALNLTKTLRQIFGQDRFHVLGVNDGKGQLTMSYSTVSGYGETTIYIAANKPMNNGVVVDDAIPITVSNRNVTVKIKKDNNGKVVLDDQNGDPIVYGEEQTDNVTVRLESVVSDQNDPSRVQQIFYYYDGMPNAGNGGENRSIDYHWENDKAVFYSNLDMKVQSELSTISTSLSSPQEHYTGTWDITSNRLQQDTAQSGGIGADGKIQITLNVKQDDADVADGTKIQVSYDGTALEEQTVTNGQIQFTITPSADAGMTSPYATPASGSKYRKYLTENAAQFFWTERAITSDGAASLAYNSPIGMTDFFITVDSNSGHATGPYRYARSLGSSDRLSGEPNASESYDAKYGTRRASQVNKGCVTTYPFSIQSTLIISATHPQYYALDLEDPSVCVWYALAGTYLTGDVSVSEQDAKLASSYFAASPRDGMDSYFLYSKRNVYYCGAGHANVTGGGKDNNDERRLFINVIVNSVTKGKSTPVLKLYNPCLKEEDKDANCEDELVKEEASKENARLSKELNKLFYNDTIGMYQINVDNDTKYPEFDFKVVPGSGDITSVTVFYDLNYGYELANTPDDMDAEEYAYSEEYTNDTNHVLIKAYDQSDRVEKKRIRLRENDHPALELKEKYFENYQNYTYIVINAKDNAGNIVTARVKVNLVAKLFDLTDATITNRQQYFTTYKFMMDITDKTKFNI